MIETTRWRDGVVRILDQTRLPDAEMYLDVREVEGIHEAIRSLRVRGAPAIGIAAAQGVALGAWRARERGEPARAAAEAAVARLRTARPTAVNLFWALDRVARIVRDPGVAEAELAERLVLEAERILDEDLEMSRRMGALGATLLPDGARVLTHCNTGGLATGGLGTALAVVYEAHRGGKRPTVYADETRPLLQGSRLTTWELEKSGIPVVLICDGAAAWTLRRKRVDAVLIGADRIAANGDTANKVGSYGLALAAREAGVPFYVVAPSSSVDPDTPSGAEIPIEERPPDEVRTVGGRTVAPRRTEVFNPAFDVTPAHLIEAIVTESGIFRRPFADLVLAARLARSVEA
jgi:methylthioribose-1-phosphate isomerase